MFRKLFNVLSFKRIGFSELLFDDIIKSFNFQITLKLYVIF